MERIKSSNIISLLNNIDLNPFSKSSSIRGSIPTCITRSAEKRKWEEIPDTNTSLPSELKEMFWLGVRRELIEIIRTLKAWEDDDELKKVELEDEKMGDICGFDTFLDHVSESSREFAIEYAIAKARGFQKTPRGEFIPSADNLQKLALQLLANEKSRALKQEINLAANSESPDTDKVTRRARLLLQSASWLDMDKVIEHRPPLNEVGFWKRPTPPQLALQRFDEDLYPVFQPASCALCQQVIRGTMFRCTVLDCAEPGADGFICQDCQHEGKHPEAHLVKKIKHCVLQSSISPQLSRQLCKCKSVVRINVNGDLLALFPVRKKAQHRKTKNGGVSCCLLGLVDAVAESKYSGILMKMDTRTSLGEQRRNAEEAARKQEERKNGKRRRSNHVPFETIRQKDADSDIPFFIRSITDKYPFGNVHMALRIGPLLIENGVENSQGGALITSRDPPHWHLGHSAGKDIEYSLAISNTRKLYGQYRGPRRAKRYKAALKQVVGGLFAGACSEELELTIIEQVSEASTFDLDNPEDHPREQAEAWEDAIRPIEKNLRSLMETRVNLLVEVSVRKLLDTSIDLKWDRQSNNCQKFCDNLIDRELYGPFIAAKSAPGSAEGVPPYLMSFICRPEGYSRERSIRTKYDVPSGLCEEYLLRFRYGLHVDSDVIDSLLEYWYDWGAFGGPLYRYQNLFPWDCTEAYSRSNQKCGTGATRCNISRHVWSFPFDSWSISELHLTRGRLMYPDAPQSGPDWLKNRLTVLLAQNALLKAAKAMAASSSFRNATAWITQHADARMDRLKLGGIHRAQPFSHYYEEGKYHQYFTADWAHLCVQDQITEYEAMRDARHALHDVKPRKLSSYGGEDNFSLAWGDPDAEAYAFYGLYTDDYFGNYYQDGWDGNYTMAECMPVLDAEVALVIDGDAAWNLGNDSGSSNDASAATDGGYIGGGCGNGCGGGGCGGD